MLTSITLAALRQHRLLVAALLNASWSLSISSEYFTLLLSAWVNQSLRITVLDQWLAMITVLGLQTHMGPVIDYWRLELVCSLSLLIPYSLLFNQDPSVLATLKLQQYSDVYNCSGLY